MFRKQAAQFGKEWDKNLYGVLWAYSNTPHGSTHEKPSFLLFGMDLRSPVEAELLSALDQPPLEMETYREHLMQTLATSRESRSVKLRGGIRHTSTKEPARDHTALETGCR